MPGCVSLATSLASRRRRNARAPGPATSIASMCDTSNMPARGAPVVLLDLRAVVQRHLPAAEVHQAGAEPDMLLVQWCSFQLAVLMRRTGTGDSLSPSARRYPGTDGPIPPGSARCPGRGPRLVSQVVGRPEHLAGSSLVRTIRQRQLEQGQLLLEGGAVAHGSRQQHLAGLRRVQHLQIRGLDEQLVGHLRQRDAAAGQRSIARGAGADPAAARRSRPGKNQRPAQPAPAPRPGKPAPTASGGRVMPAATPNSSSRQGEYLRFRHAGLSRRSGGSPGRTHGRGRSGLTRRQARRWRLIARHGDLVAPGRLRLLRLDCGDLLQPSARQPRGQRREGVEHLLATPAADLAAGHLQLLRRDPEHGVAMRAAGVHVHGGNTGQTARL